MANQLPSGRWRGRVYDARSAKQLSPAAIIGGPATFHTEADAVAAEALAAEHLRDHAALGVTVEDFWREWTTSPLWARPAKSTNLHNLERTAGFVSKFGDRPIASIGAADVAAWLKGGHHTGTVMALRAFFNDARRPQAGMLCEHNPFANLGLRQSKGRKYRQPPDITHTARMLAAADQLTPPSFAAYLLTACWSAARPGELDALRWSDLDFVAETIRIERQWNAKVREFTAPKHGSVRTVAMTAPVAERLAELPRESEFVFTTLRGTHYTPSARNLHWNRTRCAVGLGNVDLYTATRHFFGWYALNVLEDLPPHVIALQLGHTDGGKLVRELYGHPDAAIARERIRKAFREVATVTALPSAVQAI